MGIQASGKSSFYKACFIDTHAHINLDKLRTRHREQVFLEACLSTQMKFVVDNTNPTPKDRQRYIPRAQELGYTIIGYYFQSSLTLSIERNAQRAKQVPDKAIGATSSKLVLPSYEEGFDELWYVQLTDDGFDVKAWQDEV